jgi:DNA invertase Pin-like site-specific DNA recombinase
MGRKIVVYRRVSTDKQGRSGLGLDAQHDLVTAYVEREKCTVVGEFTEVETGKRNDRPELAKAIAQAKRLKATLVIAKLDRLGRSVHFISGLMESGVKFLAADAPDDEPFILHVKASFAEEEARKISKRTKEALAAYKKGERLSRRIKAIYPDGVPADVVKATAGKLGASLPQCRNLTSEARKRGAARSAAIRSEDAHEAAKPFVPEILAMWTDERLSLRAIADRLNAAPAGTTTDETEDSQTEEPKQTWSAMKIKRILNRAGCFTGNHRPIA